MRVFGLFHLGQAPVQAGPERSAGPDRLGAAVRVRGGAALWPGLGVLVLLVMGGCHSPQSSRIAIEDYQDMAEAMSQSLRQSRVFSERTPESEPMIVSFARVRNLSSEIMPQGEQWSVVASVRAAQPIDSLWDDKRVVFVIPADFAIDQRATIDAQRIDKRFGSERKVTHEITATFRSVQRVDSDGKGRTDVYQCQFEMLELATNKTVWIDQFNFKRTARGSIRD